MTKRHVHVIGAGMAGLSTALQLALSGEKVTVYEAAPFAGGRCRSFLDRELGCRVDNGNHLVLSGNVAVQDYLYLTNALDTMGGPGAPVFPFIDIGTGERWTVRMNKGALPWWIFDKNRRVLGTKPADYLSALPLLKADATDRLGNLLDKSNPLYRRFWEPFIIGALNTEPDISSALLLKNIFAQTFAVGGKACIPLIPKVGLSESFVQPCLNTLRQHDVEVKYYHRLRSLLWEGDQVRELDFNGTMIEIGVEDWVVLALPAWFMRELLPEVPTPTDFRSIINAHFRVDAPDDGMGFTGMIGGYAEWVFVRNGIASVTISCAERHKNIAVRDMAALVWHEIAQLLHLDPAHVPPHRIFLEKYATFAATPEQNIRRPTSYTGWKNVALAGEWTATGLPSTIEGALRSGMKAAQVVLRWGAPQ
ncbi:MAG: hydroxysqualene dehydroxylase HpnE [Alphaproteobacteria bacterium]|nr:hydroxysqualene dehydroxylase HpnE [Alphaproteobacteria bacterium]